VSTLTIPAVETMAGADLQICWNALTKDLLCHNADPVGNVAFLKLPNLSQAQVEDKLATGQDVSQLVSTYRELHTMAGSTCTMLSSLAYGSALIPATDYVESTTTQYVLLFTRGTTLGAGAQTMMFIQPKASSSNTTVNAPDGCGSNILNFTATLSTQPLAIPTAGPWKLDWSEITKDGFGNSVKFQNIDKVELGFYEGMTADYLQSHFLDIEIDATSLYSVAVPKGQKYVDLAAAHTAAGTAFPGFTSTGGTWAVAVLCSGCSIPAPIAFSVLQPGP
jgi:hypothetical protein